MQTRRSHVQHNSKGAFPTVNDVRTCRVADFFARETFLLGRRRYRTCDAGISENWHRRALAQAAPLRKSPAALTAILSPLSWCHFVGRTRLVYGGGWKNTPLCLFTLLFRHLLSRSSGACDLSFLSWPPIKLAVHRNYLNEFNNLAKLILENHTEKWEIKKKLIKFCPLPKTDLLSIGINQQAILTLNLNALKIAKDYLKSSIGVYRIQYCYQAVKNKIILN